MAGRCLMGGLAAASWATIGDLFLLGRPSAIFWRVITVIVDAVERALRWPLTHVGKEIAVIRPAFANCDVSSSVVLELPCVAVAAAVPHMNPRGVRPVVGAPGCLSMLNDTGGKGLLTDASTRRGIAASQMAPGDKWFGPAIASAEPVGVAALIRMGKAQCDQLSETLVGYVFEIVLHPWRIPQSA